MTEQEWQKCADPPAMLEFLYDKVNDRKPRLFAVACCRRVWELLGERSRQLAHLAELFADGLVTEAEVRSANWYEADEDPALDAAALHPDSVRYSVARAALMASYLAGHRWKNERGAQFQRMTNEQAVHCDFLRDIFGNPFRPAFDPAWLRWHDATIPRLAQQMYDSRDFASMPVLADALEEAGCTSADILEHCRGPGPHVRGCWVVDLVLGKE